MTSDYGRSVFVVSSSDPANHDFGTAFVVRTSKTIDTVVTCAHVIDTLPAGTILVGGRKADIFKVGQSDGIDLAVLRIPHDEETVPLRLGSRPTENAEYQVAAFDELSKAASLRVFDVRVGQPRAIAQRRTGAQASVWELRVSHELLRGNSGAPVIDPGNGFVVGILSYRLRQPEAGLAFAAENLTHIWRDAPLKDLPPAAGNGSSAISVDLDAWLPTLQRSGQSADRLLLETPRQEDALFLRFEDFLDTAKATNLLITTADDSRSPLRSGRAFRVALLANLIRRNVSAAKWAVAKTVETLVRNSGIDQTSVLADVWRTLCGSQHAEDEIRKILDTVFTDMRDKGHKKHEHVYEFVTFLMDEVVQPDGFGVIANKMHEHDTALGNDAPPAYLERIKRLYGQATARADRDRAGSTRIFEPEVAVIPASDLCPYEIEAMVSPITVGEHTHLTGRVIPQSAVSTLPYVFEFQTDQGLLLLNLLSADVTSLVRLCNDFSQDQNLVWDVPTICEWLALAGCETDRYPWGDAEPMPDLANLSFTRDGNQRRLKPVGTFPRGASRHKTLDCCGNVHEIVMSSPDAILSPGNFPHDYRLMGGCFKTPPSHASCHIVRPFRPKEDDDRKNVGLRLIRFSRHDRQRRKETLEHFLASNHRAARFRASERWRRDARHGV